MIDLKGRKRAAPILEPIAAGLVKIGVGPTLVTIVGLVITVVGSVLISQGWLNVGAGVAAFGVFLDALDGPVARAKGVVSDRGERKQAFTVLQQWYRRLAEADEE